MALRNIRVEGDPVLRKVCKPVTEVNDRTKELIFEPRKHGRSIVYCNSNGDEYIILHGTSRFGVFTSE